MSQISMVDDPAVAFAGLVADSAMVRDIISRITNVMQVAQVTVTGNSDGTYEILADGVVQASFVAASKTIQEIRDGLLADYATSATVEASATAISTDGIYLAQTNRDSTTDITWTVTGPGSPDISVASVISQAQRIPFGVGVVADTNAYNQISYEQCRLPQLSSEITDGLFLGIAIADVSYPNDDGSGFASQSSVPILRKGRIWVKTEDTCTEGGQVFCRFADPTADFGLGSFRSDADGSDAVAIPGAMYRRNSLAGGWNIVELNPTR